MSETLPGIIVLESQRVEATELARLVCLYFGDMVKLVVDLERGVLALGREFHADAEELLLGQGSEQTDLWGANYYPGRGPEHCIEYTALINIRPSQDNRAMEVQDLVVRAQMRDLIVLLVGEGEAL
jgi:hypothetical protein